MSGEHNFDEEEALAAGGHAEFMDLHSGGPGSGGGGVLLPMEGGEGIDHHDGEDPHTNHDGATSPVHHAPDEETPDDAEIAQHIAAAVEQELAGPLHDHQQHHQQQLHHHPEEQGDGGGVEHEGAGNNEQDGMPAAGAEDEDLAPAVVEEPLHSNGEAAHHHQQEQQHHLHQQQQEEEDKEEPQPHHSLYESQEELEEDSDGGGGQQHQEHDTSPSNMIVHPDSLPMSIPAPVATAIFDPSSPGKVVDTGREHTGRWTKEEHEAFLSALQMYGKEWKKVAAKVKTRTVVQTRTHAQKYFQKLQKSIDSGGSMDVSMGMYDTDEPGSGRKSGSGGKKKSKGMPSPMKLTRRSSQTTMSAAHVISTLSSAKPSFISAGSSTTFDPIATSSYVGMTIVAPDPTAMSKFPEPSPAATGKRKLAELAAAQMLVGVGGSGDGEFGSDRKKPSVPYPPPLQIVNPESLRASYKTATGDSPSTPWESDLLTLVNEKNRRSARAPSSVSAKIRSIVTGSSQVNPVNGPPSSYGRSPLHQAVCRGDRTTLQTLLADLSASDNANKQEEQQQQVDTVNELNMIDEAGFAPLHSACAKFLPQIDQPTGQRNDLVRMLLEAGADVAVTDRNGNTPLHWAARTGDTDAATELLSRHAPVDAINGNEETPLHWAMRTGMRGTKIVAILLANRARPSSLNYLFRRPMDVAAEGFDDQEGTVAWYNIHPDKKNRDYKKIHRMTTSERRDTRMNLFIRSDHSRTLLLHHPECMEHRARNETDWEAPDRISAILDGVKAPDICKHEVSVTSDFEKASLELLSRVHSAEYLSFVSNLSKDLEKKVKAGVFDQDSAASSVCVPFTPMVQRTMIQIEESEIKDSSDTSFSVGSLNAARRAAGAVQHAVNCVLVGRNRNAFCLVRPPGHHAGINGLLEGGESCGFCIFNNVAAGALHAIADDKLSCNRCAIVDIDVHHGNGTEEIVRRFNDPSKLFFFSIHLFDNDRKTKPGSQGTYKFYPGTGDEDELALNIINVPIVPLWKDPTPMEAAGKTHNTRKKTKVDYGSLKTDGSSLDGMDGVDYSMDAAVAVAAEAAAAVANDASPVYTGRQAYRQAIQNRLLPALRAFDPDLIMISAGFDACKGDVGNARHERGGEKIGLDLEPDDYAWTTRRILEIADICCQGRVVSVLEGGYGRSARDGLDRTGFGSAAIQHLHSLIDPYDSENRFTNP